MGRKLRVDFSNEQKTGDDDNAQVSVKLNSPKKPPANRPLPPQPTSQNTANGASYAAVQPSTLPPLPPGKDIPPGLTCTDAISRTLNTLPPAQLLDILGQMKTLASSDPQRATELLQQAPQLSYAVFQSLLLMGLVSPEAIQSVVDPNAPPGSQPAPAANYNAAPPAAGAPSAMPVYGNAPAGANNTPPVGGMPYAPPPAAGAGAGGAAAAGGQDTDGLMRALMELPQSQIDMLPESERQQVMALRAAYGGQRR